MTAYDKAAVMLLNLDPAVAADVLERLGPDQRETLRARMEQLKAAPPAGDEVDAALREFQGIFSRPAGEPPAAQPGASEPPADPAKAGKPAGEKGAPDAPPAGPGASPAQPAANPSASPSPGQPAATPTSSPGDQEPDPLAAVRLLPPDRLAGVLREESARTVALVLGYLEPEKAGAILRLMSSELRLELSKFLGKPANLNPDIVRRIARALLLKSQSLKESPADSGANAAAKRIADMLRCLDKPDRLEMLNVLQEKDPDTATAVKALLYQFEDLLLIVDRSMQKLLSQVDSKNLASALKGATEEIKEKVFKNLSSRARENLGEEMEFLGSIPNDQINQAQKAIVEVIQRLDQAGELVMQN